ncbi:MAG: phage major capsid protein [Rhizomicrobium sp.]
MELENKASTDVRQTEVKQAFNEFLDTFEDFKQANDERLKKIETRSGDCVTEEKVDRINRALGEQKRALDNLMLASARPPVGGMAPNPAGREQKAAFERYVRKGDTSALDTLELKAMSAGTSADGGYTVPLEIEQNIDSLLKKVSPMRTIATVRQIGSIVYRKPIATTGAASGWVAETGTRAQTDTPSLVAIDFPAMELYAMPAATQSLLDDSQVDLESWLAEEVQNVFAEQEGAAFISGNGTTAPKGLLTETAVANASWAWGALGYIATGASAAFPASNPADILITLAYSPKQGYRANGTWMMNRSTESAIRKFKDDNGNYIWQPGVAAGQSPTLLGYPVAEADDMPDIAENSYSIAFGDFARGYLIVDRVGVQVLRDPYSAKPYVLFYTTKRVGGGVQNYEAIKLLKFSAS